MSWKKEVEKNGEKVNKLKGRVNELISSTMDTNVSIGTLTGVISGLTSELRNSCMQASKLEQFTKEDRQALRFEIREGLKKEFKIAKDDRVYADDRLKKAKLLEQEHATLLERVESYKATNEELEMSLAQSGMRVATLMAGGVKGEKPLTLASFYKDSYGHLQLWC